MIGLDKFFEIFFESYPQAIISLFIVLRLNLSELKYIASIIISFCSLLFGVADTITFNKFGDSFTKVVWCMMSLFVDCLFRALFFSFLSASWVFPEKAGLFAMGLLYVLIIAIYIERKDLQNNNYEAKILHKKINFHVKASKDLLFVKLKNAIFFFLDDYW